MESEQAAVWAMDRRRRRKLQFGFEIVYESTSLCFLVINEFIYLSHKSLKNIFEICENWDPFIRVKKKADKFHNIIRITKDVSTFSGTVPDPQYVTKLCKFFSSNRYPDSFVCSYFCFTLCCLQLFLLLLHYIHHFSSQIEKTYRWRQIFFSYTWQVPI
jgi:hypothetical protein